MDKTNIRFEDYYDSNMFHGEKIIKYFEENYGGKDKNELIDVFALYVILKNAQDIVYNYDICDDAYELYSLLDDNNYFEDILQTIDFLKEKRYNISQSEKNILDFMSSNNKYKILFTGFSYDDIQELEKNIKKSFIRKLAGDLSNSDYVVFSDNIGHTKDLTNFPISRIQFADDYRIAYVRKDNVTAILGVTIKSGKSLDYWRYDNIAMKQDKVYEEIKLFKNGQLPQGAQHYKVMEHLLDFQEKLKPKHVKVRQKKY